ncbi:MAG TPA: F0F1 ATP synthase subunit A [Abditibacteriaceae bacterium]|jgi:F-type H+-transporting ATPase subunit a
MLAKFSRLFMALLFVLAVSFGSPSWAQDASQTKTGEHATAELDHGTAPDAENEHTAEHGNTAKKAGGSHGGAAGSDHGAGHGAGHGDGHETPNAFTPHAGTVLNPIARGIFGLPAPVATKEDHSPYKAGEKRGAEVHFTNVKYDYIVMAFIIMGTLGLVGAVAAKKARIRPEGKPMSLTNVVEASADGFQNYLVGVMGQNLAYKYAPLIASFFFTILFFNWIGLVPGLIAPTANPNVPFALALVSFFMVHIIAIKETGFKAWFMHLVGEPVWMAPLMFPLHVIGELVKPVSLALRLLGNVFGEEVVIAKLIGLAILAAAGLGLPTFIPIQFPILILSVFFGLLQAMVFSTLLAIYIAILGTHHGDHGHDDAHGHEEHVRLNGHHETISVSGQTTVA